MMTEQPKPRKLLDRVRDKLRVKHYSIRTEKGYGSVYLPYALERKYPSAHKEWCWQYVFPAPSLSTERMIPHIPPKGMQTVRYAGLYARNVKRKIAPTVRAALDALCLQIPLFDLEPLAQTFQHLKWRERIKASFGYDPLECPRCGRIMQLAEIWEPKRGHIWIKRWLETHRMRTAARPALKHRAERAKPCGLRSET